jgi:hypothetical protein
LDRLVKLFYSPLLARFFFLQSTAAFFSQCVGSL